MKKIKQNKTDIIKKIFLFFLILQPFLDCYLLYSDEVIGFFGFSPTTIIRMLIIGIYAIYVYITNKKSRKPITIYGIIIIMYMILHHITGISINNNLIYESFKYSIIDEIFYLLRMLMPVGVIYIVYNLKYTKEDLKFVIKYSSLGIAAILIILNISGVALTSYSYNNDIIQGTILDWFNNNISNYDLASKGWFNSANQISATIIIFIVMMIYYTIIETKKQDIITLTLLIISTMMIGTRTSTTIVVYVVLFMIVGYTAISSLLERKFSLNKKQISYSVFITIFTILFFGIAPVGHCQSNNNYQCLFKIDTGLNSKDLIKVDKNLKYDGDTCNFLSKTPTNPEYYEKIYPCDKNLKFWDEFSKQKVYEYANNRTMEVLVAKDLYSKIDNLQINLFGLSRSRFLNAEFYIEKDIYVHYYTMGIIGIILLLIVPYIVPCIFLIYKIIKTKNINYDEITLAFITALIFVASYLSGHILDELIATLYLGFTSGMLLVIMNDKDKNINNENK